MLDVPKIKNSLMSVGQLTKDLNDLKIKEQSERTIDTWSRKGGLYELNFKRTANLEKLVRTLTCSFRTLSFKNTKSFE